MEFNMTVFWLILAILMGLVESLTVQLVSIWFALGAIAACITSLFVPGAAIQVIVFVVVSAVALAVTRPIAKRIKDKNVEHTNADKYVGMTGVVISEIDNEKATGQVRVNSSVWSARSFGDAIIKKDTKVVVKDLQGVKLIVEESESPS